MTELKNNDIFKFLKYSDFGFNHTDQLLHFVVKNAILNYEKMMKVN